MLQQQVNPSQKSFLQLDDSVVEILMSDQLTKTDYRLFLYLFKLERWGDRFVELPSQSEIALCLGVCRETINQSQARLQNLGLFDFKITGWKVKNLVAPRSNDKLNKNHRVLEKSNTELKELDTKLEESNTDIYIDHARAQTITNLNKTFFQESEKEKEKTICNLEEFPEVISEQEPQHVQVEEEHTTSVVSSPVTGFKEPFGYRKQTPMQMQWGWLPEGPWKNQDGTLETEFVVAIAKKWVNKYGGDLHEKRGDVLRHFKNDAANLAIEWDWYQGASAQKFANLHERRALGLDTTREEREISSHEKGVAVAGAGRQASENRSPIIAPVSQDVETMDIGQSNAADYWREVYRRHSQAEPVCATSSAQGLQAARGVIESLKARQQQKKLELSSMRPAEGSSALLFVPL